MYTALVASSGLTDLIVVGDLDVRQHGIPINLALDGGYPKHLRHAMVNSFSAAVNVRVVEAGGSFREHNLMDGGAQLGSSIGEAV